MTPPKFLPGDVVCLKDDLLPIEGVPSLAGRVGTVIHAILMDAWRYDVDVGLSMPVRLREAHLHEAAGGNVVAARIAAWLRACADEERATLLDGEPDEHPEEAVSDEEAVLRERADMIERGDWRKP